MKAEFCISFFTNYVLMHRYLNFSGKRGFTPKGETGFEMHFIINTRFCILGFRIESLETSETLSIDF